MYRSDESRSPKMPGQRANIPSHCSLLKALLSPHQVHCIRTLQTMSQPSFIVTYVSIDAIVMPGTMSDCYLCLVLVLFEAYAYVSFLFHLEP